MQRWIFLLLIACLGLAYWESGEYLLRPHPSRVGAPPDDLNATQICIPRADDDCIAGWFAAAPHSKGDALLLHGSGANRRAMLGRARFLRSLGWGVLLIDLRAHGETAGAYKSAGLLESKDAASAIAWLGRKQAKAPLLIVAYSLGAAAAVLGDAAEQADALVLEALYKDLPSAIAHRLNIYFGDLGPLLTPLLTLQFRLRYGVTADELSPLQRLTRLGTPVMLIAGDRDRRSPPSDTRALYRAAAGQKALWLVPGAAHEDFYAIATEEYETRVSSFLYRQFGRFANHSTENSVR